MINILKKTAVLALSATMVFSMGLVSFADDTQADDTAAAAASENVNTGGYPYGVYVPNGFTFSRTDGKASRNSISCAKVHITNGIFADITISSNSYTHATVDDIEYPAVIDSEAKTSTFRIPVKLNEDYNFSAYSTKMNTDIHYTINISLDKDNLTAAERKPLQDGYYTTSVNTNKQSFGYKTLKDGSTQYGYSYPSNNYSLPVTIQVKDGKIAKVAYPKDVKELVLNTTSDINYLMWAMDGHNVTDYSYDYLNGDNGSYGTYHTGAPKNGTGMSEQIVANNGINGVDSVTGATVTSRAIIDSVDQSLDKAEAGQKDETEPNFPTEDTSADVIPADGYYTAQTSDEIGFDMSDTKDMLLKVENGKITAELMYIEQRQASYPNIYPGTEKDALAAGEDAWFVPTDYDYGHRSSKGAVMPGSIYKDVPIKSLDKPLNFVMLSKSSGNWFNRVFSIKSADIKKISEERAAMLKAEAAFEEVLVKSDATADEINKAKQDYIKAIQADSEATEKAANEAIAKANAEAEAAKKEAQASKNALDANKIKAAKVTGVKAKAARKQAKVSWKSLGSGYSYQVYVSTKAKKSFKKKATTTAKKATVKKLKSKKTYYVKVRAFKKVAGKNVYTGYSKVVKVKVK